MLTTVTPEPERAYMFSFDSENKLAAFSIILYTNHIELINNFNRRYGQGQYDRNGETFYWIINRPTNIFAILVNGEEPDPVDILYVLVPLN
jgi:hypothetical protein